MKTLLALCALCLTTVSIAQQRVNRQNISFQKESKKVTSATGWSFNSTSGQWVDYKNVLCPEDRYKNEYKMLQGDYLHSRYKQSFKSIQAKTVIIDSTKHYVLIVNKISGRYQYPSIKEDWYTYKETIGYIFSEEEFSKLDSITGQISLKTSRMVAIGSKYEKYNETKFLDLIQVNLQDTTYETRSMNYTFPILLSEEGKIRFYVPQFFTSYQNYDFKKEYFEIEKEDFEILLDLN